MMRRQRRRRVESRMGRGTHLARRVRGRRQHRRWRGTAGYRRQGEGRRRGRRDRSSRSTLRRSRCHFGRSRRSRQLHSRIRRSVRCLPARPSLRTDGRRARGGAHRVRFRRRCRCTLLRQRRRSVDFMQLICCADENACAQEKVSSRQLGGFSTGRGKKERKERTIERAGVAAEIALGVFAPHGRARSAAVVATRRDARSSGLSSGAGRALARRARLAKRLGPRFAVKLQVQAASEGASLERVSIMGVRQKRRIRNSGKSIRTRCTRVRRPVLVATAAS